MLLRLYYLLLLTLYCTCCYAQPVIHSHNDYTHAQPFWDAYHNKAGVIEADVFYINGVLMVAHDKKDIQPSHTLAEMYIKPIAAVFDSSKLQRDSLHSFYLMIDIKENATDVLKALMQLLQQHPAAFNREVNPGAIQVFISGERPPDTSFHSYSPYIMFDGLPGQQYAPADLDKIVMISDNFRKYSRWNGSGVLPAEDSISIRTVIKEAHAKGKPVRLWGAPDTEDCWATLVRLNADVINTDKVKECSAFLDKLEK